LWSLWSHAYRVDVRPWRGAASGMQPIRFFASMACAAISRRGVLTVAITIGPAIVFLVGRAVAISYRQNRRTSSQRQEKKGELNDFVWSYRMLP
jgi:hypothetical protein